MSRILSLIGVFGLCSALLAACSGGTGQTPLYPQLVTATKAALLSRKARREAAARPPLTRAALDTVEGSFLEIVRENTDQLAYLHVDDVRRDPLPGLLVQWRSEDDVTLTTRNGVLIATRGLGGGVVSASAIVEGDRPGPSASGLRTLDIRTGDLDIRHLELSCALDDLGPETVVIVELAHPTRHLRETCEAAGGGTIVNDYWVDSRVGLVWKSRQWAGPTIGYVRTRRLTTG